ncbi:MAG TPA: hypothetical protein PKX92_10075 [Edaphocola sp.]|nr:hypothetical protein [Edaphocola sp.]
MKLESLKNGKFEKLGKQQMQFVTGGDSDLTYEKTPQGNIQITGHSTLKDGRYEYSEDRIGYNSNGTISTKEYFIGDSWY